MKIEARREAFVVRNLIGGGEEAVPRADRRRGHRPGLRRGREWRRPRGDVRARTPRAPPRGRHLPSGRCSSASATRP